MKRAFYTNPLAAAWQAQHHGMAFGAKHNGRLVWNWVDMLNTPRPALFAEDILDDFPNQNCGSLYIHPDSMCLLKPRAGDGVEFDRLFWDRQRYSEFKDYPYQAHYGTVNLFGRDDEFLGISSAGVGWGNTSSDNPDFAIPYKIIQRNGLAFMWPEFEGAE